MKKVKSFLLILLLGITLIPIFYPPVHLCAQQTPDSDFLVLVDLAIENYPDTARLILRTNRYFEYIDYQLEDGAAGIILDPAEPLYTNLKETQFDKNGLIINIKLVNAALKQKELPSLLKEGFYPLDYLVIGLAAKTNYYVSQRANLLVIDIGKRRLPQLEEFTPSFVIKRPSIQETPAPKLEGLPANIFQPQAVKAEFVKSTIPAKKKFVKEKKEKKKEKIKPAKLEAVLPVPKPGPMQAMQPESLRMEPVKEIAPGLIMPQTLVKIPQQQEIGLAFKAVRDQIISKSLSLKAPRVDLPKGKNTFSFMDCLEMGTINFIPLVIAEEEVRLNDMKVKEATRGLYPTATAKYTTTDGETLGVEFREESYGMQVEQPVYYGGRLKLTLKQAQLNRQVAQTKFDKAEGDIVSKITETFYNMATAQLNLQDQQELFAKSKEIAALAQKKYQAELTTKLESLNVESQCNQIEYQLSVAAKDLQIARINLLQAMGISPSKEIFVDFSLDYKEQAIDINKCLLLAYQNRPELHMNELLQEVSEYEEKIAKSKDDFKVDFTGFLGESAGAYKTEPLDLKRDWYVGFKASKPWLGHTGSYNYTQNKTSPKLGQTTRTESATHSFDFEILNNLAGYSEKQFALIGKLKAENELIEMEKTINIEVREGYNNYEKSLMQIKNEQDKIRFREEELKVLQSQAELNEAFLSQVLEAMIRLNDEKALYHQAIASYKTAVANLNKAIGLVGYFQ